MALDIYKRTLDIDFERDCCVVLDPALGDWKNLKYIFPVSGIFPGKTDGVILLYFECIINPQNLMKIVGAIFEKIKIINFFLMWTTLNFRVRVKTINMGSRYLREDPRYRFLMRLMS